MYSCLTLEERKKKIDNIIELLKEGYVIVEGKKDKEALMKFGIDAITFDAIILASKLEKKLDEKLKDEQKLKDVKKIYILTDLDEEGKRKTLFLEQLLKNYNKKIDAQTRVKFLLLLNTKYVENAYTCYMKLNER